MKRSLVLELMRDTWYATEFFERIENGEPRLRKKRHNLGVKGKDKQRSAEKAMRVLEVQLLQMEQNSARAGDETTVQSFAETWLASARIDVRPNTFRSYELWVRRFLTSFGHLAMIEIGPHHVEQWKQDLFTNLSPSTVNVALRSVRAMFGKAKRQRVIRENPFALVDLADVPRRSFPPYWTTEQYLKFMETIETQRQRAGFGLAFYGGLRARECVTLRWEDVSEDQLHIVSRDDARTKGDRSRKIPLYAPLKAELDALPNLGPYVLSSEYNDISDERILSQKFLKYRRRMPTLPEITFHGLRHSFATNLAMSGIPIPVLQKLLGHQNIETTMLYTHVQEDSAIDTARRLGPW